MKPHLVPSLAAITFGVGILWLASHGLSFTMEGTSIVEYVRIPPAASINISNIGDIFEPRDLIPWDKDTVTIMIGGDVMLDRHVRFLGQSLGYDSLFQQISPLFKRADMAVVNLEGPVTSNHSKTLLPDGVTTTSSLQFTFATSTVQTLARAGITHVSLANNHTDNFGHIGFTETKRWLELAGVNFFGNPWNTSGTETTECIKDICITLVGYHEFQKGFEGVIKDVKKHATSSDLVIVMPHWGEEYVSTSSPRLRQKAQELVTAGADLVVGAHPHVVLDYEWIDDVPVFYSLGNLLFDQYFSKKTSTGAFLEIEISKEDGVAKIDRIIMHTVSNASKTGIELLGNEVIYDSLN